MCLFYNSLHVIFYGNLSLKPFFNLEDYSDRASKPNQYRLKGSGSMCMISVCLCLEGLCHRHVLAHMQVFLSRTAAPTLLPALSYAFAAWLVFMVSLQVMLHYCFYHQCKLLASVLHCSAWSGFILWISSHIYDFYYTWYTKLIAGCKVKISSLAFVFWVCLCSHVWLCVGVPMMRVDFDWSVTCSTGYWHFVTPTPWNLLTYISPTLFCLYRRRKHIDFTYVFVIMVFSLAEINDWWIFCWSIN